MKWIAIAVALSVSTGALAQASGMQTPGEPGYTVPGSGSSRTKPLSEPGRSFRGEVKGIDKVSGTITLRHGPIDSLFVPAATADYPVKDASMLKDVKVGDAVRFGAVLQGRSLLVTHIEPAN